MIGSVCRRTVSTTVYTFVVYLTAAVTVLAVNLAAGIPVAGYGAADYGAALGMAVFCTLLGHSLFSWGLKYLPAAFISVVKLMEPVFAALWALLLFREVPGIAVVLGGGLIVAGLVLYSLTAEEKRPAEEV
jgi:drug/metabolite transporter (DMT)-like permease